MLQRPRGPFQGGYGPRMMNQPFMGRGGFPPMNGMDRMGPSRGMETRGGGGFLSRLFGNSGPASGANPFTMASRSAGASTTGGGGLLRSLSNPTALSGFLTNTQKVLGTAQQIGPMIQQYGPLVRNIPAMWRLYKGFKDIPTDTEEKNSSPDVDIDDEQFEFENVDDDHERITEKRENKQKGRSVPKLYI